MAYLAVDYAKNPKAPVGKWTCAPTSSHEPFAEAPSGDITKGSNLCGQCVSYVKKVCPSLPSTSSWKKGAAVRNNATIKDGTVIATFDANGKYKGHAAIYVSQGPSGVRVYDQYITGQSPKPVGPREMLWGGRGTSNNGDSFYVVE